MSSPEKYITSEGQKNEYQIFMRINYGKFPSMSVKHKLNNSQLMIVINVYRSGLPTRRNKNKNTETNVPANERASKLSECR